MIRIGLEQRIRNDLERRIATGELRPGDRIPFEHELVAAYGCSRATVSKAMEALARAGLVERRRRAGSFVAHPHRQSAVLAVPDLARLIAERGETYGWSLTGKRPAKASDAEGAHIDGPAVRIDGIHCADGVPFALETRLISLTSVPTAGDEAFDRQAPGTWLMEQVPWTEARHDIHAVVATAEEADALQMPVGGACLAVQRWTWRSGAPVTFVRQLFPGDRYHLTAEFKPGSV